MITKILKKLSFEEYLAYDDGTDYAYEYDNGYLIFEGEKISLNTEIFKDEVELVKGFPKGQHQEIAWQLCQKFNLEIEALKLDWIARPAQIGVATVVNKIRIPDVCVCQGNAWRSIATQAAILPENPLLVVEVVSEGTKTIDYRHKLAEYQAIAIPEYWIVDFLGNKVTVLILVDGLYEASEYKDKEALITSQTFPQLKLTLPQILEV